ncbi:MAG: glutathione S-transferase N-terminal domain-containing protein [Sandaracinus sp.]
MTEPLRLYTFSLSHFSEKIRWLLALEGIPFVETAWTPGLHVPRARWRGRGTSVPIVESGGESVQDSTRIVHWLDARGGGLGLLPKDAGARAEVLALEARFDAVGEAVSRVAYAHLLADTETVLTLWGIDASAGERLLLRAGYPLLRRAFRRRARLDDRAALARARERLLAGLDEIATRTAARETLVGTSLTVADVTAAALLAPVACPDEHPVYASPLFREITRVVAPELQSHAALDWVRRTYRAHRGDFPRAARVRAALGG